MNYSELQERLETLKETIKRKNKEIEDLKKKVVVAEGWKGEGELEIERQEDFWNLTEYRKEKETGEIKTSTHQVPHANVTTFLHVLKDNFKKGQEASYREFVPKLISNHQATGVFPKDITVDNIGGGKNRADYYFPYYYFCAKIAESLGLIKYGGRGEVTLL